jgi:cobalt-zinc-cadmium efflux system outer membrane protein
MAARSILFAVALLVALGAPAIAQEGTAISYAEAIALARHRAPDLALARGRESIAQAEIGVAGVYPNPSLNVGTSTQTAKLSAGASIPLVILGQRGAAIDASRAELATVQVETEVAWNDVRAATGRAFVALWLAQRTAEVREDAAALAARIDDAVRGRVAAGAAPELEGLRARAERLRADADAVEARELVAAAASELGTLLGLADGRALRAKGEPDVPAQAPALPALRARVGVAPSVRREEADARAANARADRERALVRPALTLDVGVDVGDPTLPATNYRAQLGVEVPVFNQRGPLIERELRVAAFARQRASIERVRLAADLATARARFEAVAARTRALEAAVVPAAEAAARATDEAYALGRVPLVAVLDAKRARDDARLTSIEARADRAYAWIELERAAALP